MLIVVLTPARSPLKAAGFPWAKTHFPPVRGFGYDSGTAFPRLGPFPLL